MADQIPKHVIVAQGNVVVNEDQDFTSCPFGSLVPGSATGLHPNYWANLVMTEGLPLEAGLKRPELARERRDHDRYLGHVTLSEPA